MLYQLSYFRKNTPFRACLDSLFRASTLQLQPASLSGKRWIRTTEGKNQQIYSLPHLATLVSSQYFKSLSDLVARTSRLSRWRDSNPRPADYKSAALANWATSALTLSSCKGTNFFLISKFFGHFFEKTFVTYSSSFQRTIRHLLTKH